MKTFIKKYFKNLIWFYSYLGPKLFSLVFFSVMLGLLDGIGLTMFLPILQMSNGELDFSSESSQKLYFLFRWLSNNGIQLSFFTPLFLMVLFFILKGFAKFFSEIYRVNLQQTLLKKIRLDTLKLLNNYRYKSYITSDKGQIQNTLTGELDKIQQIFVYYFRVLENVILVLLYMGLAFLIDIKFALVVTIAGALTNTFFSVIFKKTKSTSHKLTSSNNYLQNQIIQQISNFKYLRATGSLNKYFIKLKRTIENIEKSRGRIGILNGFQVASREPTMVIIITLVIIIQIKILEGDLGPIIISLLFFYRALSSLNALQNSWNVFLSLSGSIENLKSLIKELSKEQEIFSTKIFSGFKSHIKLVNVYFSYNKKLILKNINLTIKKNSSIAIIGESGGGKTTMVNIIVGLLNIDRGSLLLDGTDLREYDIRTFQKKIGYITQESVIFNDSLYNNVTLWDEKNDKNMSRFLNAISFASLTEIIESYPQKEETNLGLDGINLSGGQKQRISIARELYKDIEILIFDEATSSLDTDTEIQIQKSIDSLKGELTIFTIAHRLSTIKKSDEIIILKDGNIIDKGHYLDLIKNNHDFKRLIDLQS